jgi:hypothetical protein
LYKTKFVLLQQKTMLQVIIREEDKTIFARERYGHIHPRVCRRMDAQHLKASGERTVYFADTAHFVHGAFIACVWCTYP